MRPVPYRSSLFALLLAAACTPDESPTGPSLAKASGGAQFSVAPTAVGFTFPPGGSEVVTISSQYVTTVTSSSSDAGCATVSPTNVPTSKPRGSSFYIATFTVTAAGAGSCTITLKDKNGKAVTVQVTVALPDRIVYASYANGTHDVYVMDLDGQNKTALTTTTDQDEWGILSPDGRKVLFVWSKQVTGVWQSGFNIMGVDGSGVTPIEVTGQIFNPAFSPTSGQLVFGRTVEDRQRIFKADLSGANEVQLTFPGTPVLSESSPAWGGGLPGRIVFVRSGIWIMNPDGSGQTRLIESPSVWFHGPTSADLSPDGTKVVFACQPSGHDYDICTVNVDGTGITRLIDAVGTDNWPHWTRDGRIVFTGQRGLNQDVYIMNADGTGLINLTNSDDEDETTMEP